MRPTLADTPAHLLWRALRDGKAKPTALWREAAERHARTGEKLNAYKHWMAETAEAQARAAEAAFAVGVDTGPMQGLPISIKDVYGIKGTPTYAGTARHLPAKYEEEGPIVTALRRQLAVFPGKTHTVPFAFGGIGANAHWGAPWNPWDATHHRGTGGSSSGAGGSLWENSAAVSVGSDAGGSIRMPASLAGIVGLKPSIGRWSGAGAPPLSPSLDCPGPLALSVADVAFGFAAVDPAGLNWPEFWKQIDARPLAGLRIGVGDRYFFEGCGPGIAEAIEATLKELEAKGAILAPVPMPEIEEAVKYMANGSVGVPEGFAIVSTEFKDWVPELDANVWARLKNFGDVSAAEYLSRQRARPGMSARAHARLDGIDVLATPTTAVTAPRLDQVEDREAFRLTTLRIGRNVSCFNVWDMPALSMPVAFDPDRLPIGLQLVAGRRREEHLLACALAIEKALGDIRQRLGRPPMCPA
ncbi:MAG: amidase [Alphaproteobacteria bacterium]|nr:amidase [Alphaproteobacteria bacterium]